MREREWGGRKSEAKDVLPYKRLHQSLRLLPRGMGLVCDPSWTEYWEVVWRDEPHADNRNLVVLRGQVDYRALQMT